MTFDPALAACTLHDHQLQAWDLPEAPPVARGHAIAHGNRRRADHEIVGLPPPRGPGRYLVMEVAVIRGSSFGST